MSLRRRLTLWYGGLLAAVLLVAFALAYLIHVDDHDRDVDEGVLEMSEVTAAEVRDQLDRGATLDGLFIASPHGMLGEPHALWVYRGERLAASTGDAAASPFADIGAAGLEPGWRTSWTVDGRVRTYTVGLEGTDARIVAAVTLAEIDASNAQLRFMLILLGLGAVAVGAAGGSSLAGTALRPLARITEAAAEIAGSRDFSRRVGVDGDPEDELARLGVTFDEMLSSLDDAYRQQQRFVGDVSHELRTPLTTIRGNAELLASGEGGPAEQREAVAQIRREAERLARLVPELLVLARADAVEAFAPRPVQLDEVLMEAFGELRASAGPRLRVTGLDAVTVDGEGDRLKQLVLALADNALRYTPDGGAVELSIADDGADAVLRVTDEGIGIAPIDLPRVYDRFYRGDAARRVNPAGSGLGLAIVRWIVQRHGGSIAIASRGGRGTLVTVRLPLRRQSGVSTMSSSAVASVDSRSSPALTT